MREKLKSNMKIESVKFKVQSVWFISHFTLSTLIVIIISSLLFACNSKVDSADTSDTYTCPMHPTVISDRQGVCPVCNMDLVRKARPGEEIAMTEELARLIKSPSESVISSVRTIKGTYQPLPHQLTVQGIVTYDPRFVQTISSRIAGRLEQVWIKSEFQPVGKGEKIAEIYSPELITAQREWLYLLENDPENTDLLKAARNRVKLLGVSDTQLDRLIKNPEVIQTITLYSDYAGYVITPIETSAASQPSQTTLPMNAGPMGKSLPDQPMNNTTGGWIREGDYVQVGERLFTIASSNALVLQFNVPSDWTKYMKAGDSINWKVPSKEYESGTIGLVQPFFAQGEEFARISVYITKQQNLLIGQQVEASIQFKLSDALWIPREALMDLGSSQIVFVKERGAFKPREVITGASIDTWVEIRNGIASSDELATHASYLVDSESFIKLN